jgi:hypothetical protein
MPDRECRIIRFAPPVSFIHLRANKKKPNRQASLKFLLALVRHIHGHGSTAFLPATQMPGTPN